MELLATCVRMILSLWYIIIVYDEDDFIQLFNRFQLFSSDNCFPKLKLLDKVRTGKKWPF